MEDVAYSTGAPTRPGWFDQWEFDWRDHVNINWEMIIGGNWLVRIGVLAVVVGAGLFLALAFDSGWIPDYFSVILGIVIAGAMLGAGERYHRRYPVFGQALSGGGLGVLYMSIFAGFAVFDLIGVYPALGILLVVAIGGAWLAIRYESIALSLLGIFGAYAAPFIVGGIDQETVADTFADDGGVALMLYILAVSAGVLALSTFRNWRWFTLAGLAGALISYGLWQLNYESTNVALAWGGLSGIFLIYVGATTLFHFVWLKPTQPFDRALMTLNAKSYLGISYAVLWNDYHGWLGGFTFLLALFYGGIAYGAYLRARENVQLILWSLGIAVIFLTIAIPVQLNDNGPAVSVGWAAEAVVLMWFSFKFRMGYLRIGSYVAFIGSAVWLLGIDTPEALDRDLTPVLNEYMPVFLVAVAAPYLMAYLLRRNEGLLLKDERKSAPTVLFFAGALLLTVAVPVQLDSPWVSVAWAIEAAALVWLSFRLGIHQLRDTGYLVFIASAVWLLAIDTPDALTETDRVDLLLYIPVYLVAVIAVYFGAYLLRRNAGILRNEEQELATRGFLYAGALFLSIAFVVQAISPWVSVAWAVEAAVLMWLSFRLGMREVRESSYLVFIASAMWLLRVDTPAAFDESQPDALVYVPVYLVMVAATYFSAGLLQRNLDSLQTEERQYSVGALFLVGTMFLTLAIPVQFRDAGMAPVWALEALALMWLGIRYRVIELRAVSIAVFALAAVRVLAFDTVVGDFGDLEYMILLNKRTLAYGSVIAAIGISIYLLRRDSADITASEREYALPAVAVAANFLALVALSAEIFGAVDNRVISVAVDTGESIKSLGLTVLWAAYAMVALVFGFWRRWRLVRVGSLLLLAIPVLKLFTFDAFQLDQAFRVAAFLVLGMLLVLGGYFYQRNSGTIRDFLRDPASD
jgi:uncharacterized membrane protein